MGAPRNPDRAKVTKPLRSPAAIKGRPKGTPKTGGKVKGSKNKTTIAREQALSSAYEDCFAHLTEAQIDALEPLDVLRMVMHANVRARQPGLAALIARDMAPYRHAKLAPKIVKNEDDDEETTITIRGGFRVD